jgi:hypothetical protein
MALRAVVFGDQKLAEAAIPSGRRPSVRPGRAWGACSRGSTEACRRSAGPGRRRGNGEVEREWRWQRQRGRALQRVERQCGECQHARGELCHTPRAARGRSAAAQFVKWQLPSVQEMLARPNALSSASA